MNDLIIDSPKLETQIADRIQQGLINNLSGKNIRNQKYIVVNVNFL